MTTAVAPTQRPELTIAATRAEVEAEQARGVLAQLQGFEVVDSTTLAHAEQALLLVKAKWKEVDKAKSEIASPLWNAHRAVTGYFSPALNTLSKVETELKSKIAGYRMRVESERRLMVAVNAPVELVSAPVEHTKGVSVRTQRRFRVTDPDRVPRQFCSPDVSKIQAHIAAGGLEAIAGVEWYDEQIVSARTR